MPAFTPGTRWSPSGIRRLARLRDYGVLVCLIAMCSFIALSSDRFLTKENLLNLLDQNTSIVFIACAGTLVMIAGGVDLSVSAIYALSGMLTAKLTVDVGPIVGILVGVGVGAVAGLVNGVSITAGRVNPFIATLASALIFTGVTLVVASGGLSVASNTTLASLGQDKFLGILWSSWVFIAFALLMGFVLQRTLLGRYIYSVGGNREAARLSGIRVSAVITTTFVLSGLAAGLAGTLYLAKVSAAQPDAGADLALGAVAAIVVGGISITGGEGAIWRTIVGVFFLGVISNGFNLLGWNPLYQQIIQGGIILAAVAADVRVKSRK